MSRNLQKACSPGLIPVIALQGLDNYLSLQTDNVSEDNGLERLGITPRTIDTVVPDYLAGSLHQRRLQTFRERPRH